MNNLQLDFEWQDPAGAKGDELCATWASLSILIDGNPVTELQDKQTKAVRTWVFLPLFPLAEWLADNWWFLRSEVGRSLFPRWQTVVRPRNAAAPHTKRGPCQSSVARWCEPGRVQGVQPLSLKAGVGSGALIPAFLYYECLSRWRGAFSEAWQEVFQDVGRRLAFIPTRNGTRFPTRWGAT